MTGNLDMLSKIEASMNIFTRSEIKVARFVLEQPQRALYTSITDLADQCGVGDTTVFRFCKTLGLKGFQEFKMQLAQSLSEKKSAAAAGEVAEIGAEDTLADVVRKTAAVSLSALQKTVDLIDFHALSGVVDTLVRAERVLVCGAGSSQITALDVANKFLRITPKFVCNLDPHQQAMAGMLLDEKDVALIISFSGATKDMVHIAQLVRERGAKVISITRYAKSPLSACSDSLLLCGANESPFQGGSMSGKMSQLLLLEIMYNEYYKRTYEQSQRQNELAALSVLDKLY